MALAMRLALAVRPCFMYSDMESDTSADAGAATRAPCGEDVRKSRVIPAAAIREVEESGGDVHLSSSPTFVRVSRVLRLLVIRMYHLLLLIKAIN